MPVIEQKTTNKNKVDFDLNRLDKSKTTIFSKYPFKNYIDFGALLSQGAFLMSRINDVPCRDIQNRP